MSENVLPVKIVLVDDHAMFRSGLRMVLTTGLKNCEVYEAGSMAQVIQLSSVIPSILLLDIQLPGLNGLEGITLLKRKWPLVQIVMLSADSSHDTMHRAMERGADRFVPKTDSADQILRVLHQVMDSRCHQEQIKMNHPINDSASKSLTPRQLEVLDLLCHGLSNKLIGRRLGLSENTVRGHVQAILAAFEVVSRSEAVFVARQRGIIN